MVRVRNEDLHGSAPDKSPVVLLLIDVINDMDFGGGQALLAQALPTADRIAALKVRARAAGIPSIYVNDNFGRWQSDLNKILAHTIDDDTIGRPVAERLRPAEDDYFVLKPKHSGFYSTTLEVVLRYLHATTLILTGMATDVCVLFTANDAYMRDYDLVVPSDCVASSDPRESAHALRTIGGLLKADTRPSAEIDLRALGRRE
jgi:nicotinamidase-related amidase